MDGTRGWCRRIGGTRPDGGQTKREDEKLDLSHETRTGGKLHMRYEWLMRADMDPKAGMIINIIL